MTFWPDDQVFHDVNEDNERVSITFEWDVLVTHLREMAFLNKGLTITLTDNRGPEEEHKNESFCFEGGISSYVEYLNNTRSSLHKPPIYFEQAREDVVVECALQWTDLYSDSVHTFVNNINTHDGGTHLTGFRNALTRVINDYSRKNSLVKENEANFSGDDVREGLTAIVSVKVPEPQFEGQTKARLGNREVQSITQSVVSDQLSDWLELNPKPAKEISR